MNGFWETLGISPTRDEAVIRKAYAEQARACHPEDDQEGFLRLRQAYQAALAWAESGGDQLSGQGNRSQDNRGDSLHQDYEDEDEPEEPAYWRIPEVNELPNPYENGEAIGKFLELYQGGQRKDARLWMDYFTSDAFLDAGWDADFTSLLLEKVTETEQTLPPSKEFLMWLCMVYQISADKNMKLNYEEGRLEVRERQLRTVPGTEFEGLLSILCITAKGPIPKRPGGDELAMKESFRDYRHLNNLADSGTWNVQAKEEYLAVLNRYIPFYIKDRCDPKANPEHQRHPAGLRLILHFLRRNDLPEELYRDVWRKLDLKSAVMGRGKILYGPLRELVMERVPGIAGEKPENFLQLNRDHDAYRARIKAHPEREDAESAAFFAREDMQAALKSPRFAAEQLLTYTNWRREGMGEGLVRRMLAYYREHPEIPRAGEVAAGLAKDLRARTTERWNREDAQAEVYPWYARLTLKFRPLFRYWLNTAFYTAQDPQTGDTLLEYLEENLPYQPEWSRRFAEPDGKAVRKLAVCMGEVELDFCRRHIEYYVKDLPVYRPCLDWERTEGETGDGFFWILPLTAAPLEYFDRVTQEIARRLEDTAAPEEDREQIARCLAGSVCCLPRDESGTVRPPEKVLPLTLWAESGQQLFGCAWYEGEGTLTLFEQTAAGSRVQKQQSVSPWDAFPAARRLLEEAVSPEGFRVKMREAPWHLYFTELSGPEQEWEFAEQPELPEEKHTLENAVEVIQFRAGQERQQREEAEDAVKSLLLRYGRGELKRLEIDWFAGQLVFLKEPSGYACLYFEDRVGFDIWYAVLSQPEVYRTVEDSDTIQVPFGMGTLPSYAVHEGPESILRETERIFGQLLEGRPQSQGAGGWLWDCHVNRQNGRHKLLMARQKVGGFPPNRSRQRMAARYIFSRYPVQMETLTPKGERTLTEIRSGSYGKASEGLLQFMGGKLARLRLTWAYGKPEESRRHLVFLQDGGRFLLCWLEDERVYFSRSSEKPGTELFCGQEVPAAWIHRDLRGVRDCVDLLLDDLDCTEPVIERYFCPLESYGTLRALWAEN